MTSHSAPRALGAFLRARRAQLHPRECGLPETDSARRVAGLRREEVTQLAAISVDHYTRLEQGRVRASAPVLTTLARALRLDDDQQHYLYELVGRTDARPRHRRPAQRTRPAMRRLLDQLTHTPALVLGKRLDILAWNPAAVALYTDFAAVPANRRNYLRLMFTDPAIRGMHQDWAHDARDAVAALRMEAAADPRSTLKIAHVAWRKPCLRPPACPMIRRRATGPSRTSSHVTPSSWTAEISRGSASFSPTPPSPAVASR
ncbi:helix-turn-helix domain-containing protein [Streptomyces sp. NPDC059340]|uniref:helix-turn-helix domain-containing protein n=1 Tax=Streptomyces sp. NPDC059340 TaxID=3346806 RepID=UPI0036A65263